MGLSGGRSQWSNCEVLALGLLWGYQLGLEEHVCSWRGGLTEHPLSLLCVLELAHGHPHHPRGAMALLSLNSGGSGWIDLRG